MAGTAYAGRGAMLECMMNPLLIHPSPTHLCVDSAAASACVWSAGPAVSKGRISSAWAGDLALHKA
jgi:hypothetical protein